MAENSIQVQRGESRAGYTSMHKAECIETYLERKEHNPDLSQDEFAMGLPGNITQGTFSKWLAQKEAIFSEGADSYK